MYRRKGILVNGVRLIKLNQPLYPISCNRRICRGMQAKRARDRDEMTRRLQTLWLITGSWLDASIHAAAESNVASRNPDEVEVIK
jgi:hypothetical protein